jgi:hypothetical protein
MGQFSVKISAPEGQFSVELNILEFQMTIDPADSFVLWAIPRFHRTGKAKNENLSADAQRPGRIATSETAKAAHDSIQVAQQSEQQKAAAF